MADAAEALFGRKTIALPQGGPLYLQLKRWIEDAVRRGVIKPIVEGARRRFGVASAEVDGGDSWQRATLGFAAVSNSVHHATEVIDDVERFVWSSPGIQVLSSRRLWLEES